jgi:hypothetical protein
MKKKFLLIFNTLTLCLLSANCWSQAEKLLTNNPLKNQLDTAVQVAATDYMANPGTFGLSIAIYQDGRSFIYNYGESKKGTGQLIKANQLFNLGSVAKISKDATVIAPKTIFNKHGIAFSIFDYRCTEPNITFFIFDYRPNVVKGFTVFISKNGKCFSIIKAGLAPCTKP